MGSNPILSAILIVCARPNSVGRFVLSGSTVFVIIKEGFDIQIQLFKNPFQRLGLGAGLSQGVISARAIAGPVGRDVHGRDKDNMDYNEKQGSHDRLRQ
jgi:hypothetical protein